MKKSAGDLVLPVAASSENSSEFGKFGPASWGHERFPNCPFTWSMAGEWPFLRLLGWRTRLCDRLAQARGLHEGRNRATAGTDLSQHRASAPTNPARLAKRIGA